MSRWYDQHRLEKRIRRNERLQAVGAHILERITAHLIDRNKQLKQQVADLRAEVRAAE